MGLFSRKPSRAEQAKMLAISQRIMPIALLIGLLAGCASPLPPVHLRSWESMSPIANCPYRNVYVEFAFNDMKNRETLYTGWQEAEIDRQKMIGVLAGQIQRAGWVRVVNEEEAAFIVGSTGMQVQGISGQIGISLGIGPTLKVAHHAYIASLSDPEFPLPRDGFGASQTIYVSGGSYTNAALVSQLDLLLQASQVRSLPTVAALCDVRAQLTNEGTSLEELREELVREIEQVRERHRQEKRLQIDVE